MQASLDPAGRTLDLDVEVECCEARVQSRNSPKPFSCASNAHTIASSIPKACTEAHSKHSATSRDQEHQMITRLCTARMGQDHPPNQPVQTSNGQYMPIRQGAACMAPEETTTQTSLTRSGRPRPSAPQKHSTVPLQSNLPFQLANMTPLYLLPLTREPASLCCCHSKVKLEPLGMPPEPLKTLYLGETSASKHFLQHTRQYNCAFSMTSFGCHEVRKSGWNPSFKIQGQICHKMGSLCPLPNEVYIISYSLPACTT